MIITLRVNDNRLRRMIIRLRRNEGRFSLKRKSIYIIKSRSINRNLILRLTPDRAQHFRKFLFGDHDMLADVLVKLVIGVRFGAASLKFSDKLADDLFSFEIQQRHNNRVNQDISQDLRTAV